MRMPLDEKSGTLIFSSITTNYTTLCPTELTSSTYLYSVGHKQLSFWKEKLFKIPETITPCIKWKYHTLLTFIVFRDKLFLIGCFAVLAKCPSVLYRVFPFNG